MALSQKAKDHLAQSMAGENRNDSDEICSAIDSSSNRVADSVDPIGTTTDLVGVDGTGSNAAPLVETEDRLDAIEAKVDEIISALKSAKVMNS